LRFPPWAAPNSADGHLLDGQGLSLRRHRDPRLGQNILAVTASPFTERQIDKTRAKLPRCTWRSPACPPAAAKYPEKRDVVLGEIRQYIDLAAKLSTPFIRILGDWNPRGGRGGRAYVAGVLTELADMAEPRASRCWWRQRRLCDSRRLAGFWHAVGRPSVAALWDMHHTYASWRSARGDGEKPGLAHPLHPHEGFVVENGRCAYRMMGEGDLPVYQMLDALKDIGYDGYVSLEWVKRGRRT
jgi:fatty-acyl-CoA synthase